MENETLVYQWRKRIEEKLQKWIPDDEGLRVRELAIFDAVMSRREFLKTGSAVVATGLLSACDWIELDKTPSKWKVVQTLGLDENDIKNMMHTMPQPQRYSSLHQNF